MTLHRPRERVPGARGLSAGLHFVALLFVLVPAGCVPAQPLAPTEALPEVVRIESRDERLDRARALAARFLIDRQAPDGAWRSDVYGSFKDGDALTPLVLEALQTVPSADESNASRKGLDYLTGLTRPGNPQAGLNYPVYTAALGASVLGKSPLPEHQKGRDIWLAFLRGRQLTELLGWKPEDLAYGGWCFGEPPRRQPGADAVVPFAQANISATVFAVEALRAAGTRPDDPALRAARVFLSRCQNYGTAADDGGFFFSCEDVVRNKAGTDGERYRSYGSATADGLRGLLACGGEEARTRAARQWLERNFSATSHPGRYAADREAQRDAVYYYWCRSVVLACTDPAWGGADRAAALADALLTRQRPDGSWSNSLVEQREDDPLVGTSFALLALSACCRTR